MKHPKKIEEITAPWMTDVLRGAGILRRATVLAVDVHAIGQGVGFLSGRARVTLTYDQAEEGAPASVVVKLPTNIKAGADFSESTHAYAIVHPLRACAEDDFLVMSAALPIGMT